MEINGYLDQAEQSCSLHLLLDFDGYIIDFLTNSAPLLKELHDYYKHFLAAPDATPDCTVRGLQLTQVEIAGDWQVKQPDPGKTKIKEHLLSLDNGHAVRKILTGVHLLFAGTKRVCLGPLEDHPNQVVNFINNMHLDYCLSFGGQLFHASGVCSGDIGLGMAGQSGKGKSTLALRLLQNGLDLVSNDRLVVTRRGTGLHMQGIAKYPRINPGTIIHQPELLSMVTKDDLARYRAMDSEELWCLEEKYDAFVEEAFGAGFRLGAEMNMFVALDWDRHSSEPARLEKRDPAQCLALVETIMKSPGVMLPKASQRIPQAEPGPYVELLHYCDFYVLSGGVDFDAAAAQIKALLADY